MLYLYLQEGNTKIFLKVELILTLEQFWKVHSEVSILYPSDECYIICESEDIPCSCLLTICTPPSTLLKLDSETSSLISVGQQVN